MEESDLFGFKSANRLTVEEAFSVLWKEHLGAKVCARSFNSNRKAICKTIGQIYFDALTEPDILRHMDARKLAGVGPQTIRHDLKIITLCYNKFRLWRKRKYVLSGIDFSKLLIPEDNPAEDIKKPKGKPRYRIISPNEFSRFIEHATERLKRRCVFAIDTGLSPVDLKMLKPSHYNQATDCLDLVRHKSGKAGSIPVTARCREIIFEALKEGREFVLDWTNDQKEVEQARKASGVSFLFGRDLRKTYANAIYRATKDPLMVSEGLLHSDSRTAVTHYIMPTGNKLRPVLNSISEEYR